MSLSISISYASVVKSGDIGYTAKGDVCFAPEFSILCYAASTLNDIYLVVISEICNGMNDNESDWKVTEVSSTAGP